MLHIGGKFHFKYDEKKMPLTVKGISPDGLMLESEEYGGWSWIETAVEIKTVATIDDQLNFLGM